MQFMNRGFKVTVLFCLMHEFCRNFFQKTLDFSEKTWYNMYDDS